jgi:hypothetical protein
MGDQGGVASICPANLTGDKNAADYGYNPAVNALVDRLRTKLRGRCLSRQLTMQTDGAVACAVLEGFNPGGSQPCNCEGDSQHPGRVTATPDIVTPEIAAEFSCVCEIVQLGGAQLASCQTQVTMDMAAAGWCYVDPAQSMAPGDTGPWAMVRECASTEKRMFRFSQSAEPRPGATAFLVCPDQTAANAPMCGRW